MLDATILNAPCRLTLHTRLESGVFCGSIKRFMCTGIRDANGRYIAMNLASAMGLDRDACIARNVSQ